jgi:Skp family chaperone for outer membrane proteins
MPDVIIPEAVLDEFLKVLHAQVTRELEAFRARLAAHEALLRAQLEVARDRKLREVEEEAERKLCEVEEAIERRARAFEVKQRAFEERVERLRQIERGAAAVREDKDRLQ